jgi:hypothetical protein
MSLKILNRPVIVLSSAEAVLDLPDKRSANFRVGSTAARLSDCTGSAEIGWLMHNP